MMFDRFEEWERKNESKPKQKKQVYTLFTTNSFCFR